MTRQAETGSRYIHGTDPVEQSRLSLLNDILNAASIREMQLKGGERILDVGSGLGQLTRAMARAAGPSGRVVGIERSGEQIAEAWTLADRADEVGLVEFRHSDVTDPPLSDEEWGSFDVVHARFLLEHVPDPASVVRMMVRAARPGGRIILEDDSHEILRLWPEPPGFARLWTNYIRTYDRAGNDPFIGHRLVSLLAAAGAEPTRITWPFFGGCQGDARFGALVENLAGVLEGAKDQIVAEDLLDLDDFEEGVKTLRAWSRRPGAAFWYATSWAEGRRSESGAT